MKRRNIVLLSDGTGNSAAKLNKTNVWRLYQALDVSDGRQIAFYDDGVGTSGFRPLRLLGGIFGWGLSRNVRDLYLQLCEHYRHVDDGEEPVDHIYIFGFSRGAYTARTLAGLIGKCGVLDGTSEEKVSVSRFRWRTREAALDTDEGMRAGVNLAYRSYRYRYGALLTNIWRKMSRLIYRDVPKAKAFKSQYSRHVDITFVGVWDTVAAVGLPIEELSLLVDEWIYPHRFSDQNLADHVLRACHALAVDDQRQSFHPVLWNEKKETDPGRITQVWFPGMHADVGGGYADDGLAYVPLKWMVDQAKRPPNADEGLDFRQDAIDQIESRSNASARMHNSRAGFGVYYRYKPRDIDQICQRPDGKTSVEIDEPKLHHSIFDRVAGGTDGYAPTGVPTAYRQVDAKGEVVDGTEDADQRKDRAELLDRSKDHIFWQRFQYFLFTFVTLAIVAFPYFSPPVTNGGPEDGVAATLGSIFGAFESFVPGFVAYWFDSWAESWRAFLMLVAIYIALTYWASWVRTNTIRLSELAWWHVGRPGIERKEADPPGSFERLANRLRASSETRRGYRFITKKALPWASLVVALLVVAGVLYRLFVHVPAAEAEICGTESKAITYDFGDQIPFDTSNPCLSTGLTLYAGQTYKVDIENTEDWKDATIPASPAGFDNWLTQFHPIFLATLPAKRVLTYPWFTMVAEVAGYPGETYPLRESITISPTITGELRLYVNDAVFSYGERRQDKPLEDWDHFYSNNAGGAKITVTEK